MIVDKIALILVVIGALNWGAVGLFTFDAVAWICGGSTTLLARIIFAFAIVMMIVPSLSKITNLIKER